MRNIKRNEFCSKAPHLIPGAHKTRISSFPVLFSTLPCGQCYFDQCTASLSLHLVFFLFFNRQAANGSRIWQHVELIIYINKLQEMTA